MGNQAFQRHLNSGELSVGLIAGARSGLGNHAVQRLVQTKLMVGPPGDRFEQEADRVADEVVKSPSPAAAQSVQRAGADEEEVQTKPLAAGITPFLQRAAEEEEELQTKPLSAGVTPFVQRAGADEEEVQTKPLDAGISPFVQRAAEEEEELQTKSDGSHAAPDEGFEAGPDLQNRLSAQSGGGSALPAGTRTFMESQFGTDFGNVRVHTGGEAVQMNRELNAQAFTHGTDIYFNSGKYNPDSSDGRRLLAHELTHVVQQNGTVPPREQTEG